MINDKYIKSHDFFFFFFFLPFLDNLSLVSFSFLAISFYLLISSSINYTLNNIKYLLGPFYFHDPLFILDLLFYQIFDLLHAFLVNLYDSRDIFFSFHPFSFYELFKPIFIIFPFIFHQFILNSSDIIQLHLWIVT